MFVVKKSLATIALGLCLGLPAHAATISTWDFASDPNSGAGKLLDPYLFLADTGVGIEARAYQRFERSQNGVAVMETTESIIATVEGSGIGVKGPFERHMDNSNLIDNVGPRSDFIVLSTAAPNWDPVKASFSGFDHNDGVTISAYGLGNVDLTDLNAVGNLLSVDNILGSFTDADDAVAGDDEVLTLDLSALVGPFQYFVFEATYGANGVHNNANSFHLASFSGTLSAVPVPAALPLLATGLLGIGLLGRRRKSI